MQSIEVAKGETGPIVKRISVEGLRSQADLQEAVEGLAPSARLGELARQLAGSAGSNSNCGVNSCSCNR